MEKKSLNNWGREEDHGGDPHYLNEWKKTLLKYNYNSFRKFILRWLKHITHYKKYFWRFSIRGNKKNAQEQWKIIAKEPHQPTE